AQVVDHGIDVVFELGNLAARLYLNRTRQVAFGNSGSDFGNRAHLVGKVVGQQIHVASEVLPRSRSAGHVGLAAQAALHANFAGHRGHLIGERSESTRHVVDSFGERGHFALCVYDELLREIAGGDGSHNFHDSAYLLGEVGGHDVHVVSEVFPGSSDARHFGLAAKFAFGADFASDAGDFAGKAVQLVHHGVDGV